MSQEKFPTLEATMSGGTAASTFSTPNPEAAVQRPDRAMLELSTPNMLEKGEIIEDLFKRLLPHGKPNCVTHLLTNETIDEAISRIETLEGMYKMYWILVNKAQNANQGTDYQKKLTQEGQAAVNQAMHLLAIEINLKKGSLDHLMATITANRRTRASMQYDVQTKILWKIGIISTSQQTQGEESKEDAVKEGSKPSDNCAGFSGEDRSTMEDGMPKSTTTEQLQKMQDKADVISKLQQELQKYIQAFKFNRL
jgi:hypothetical protein